MEAPADTADDKIRNCAALAIRWDPLDGNLLFRMVGQRLVVVEPLVVQQGC